MTKKIKITVEAEDIKESFECDKYILGLVDDVDDPKAPTELLVKLVVGNVNYIEACRSIVTMSSQIWNSFLGEIDREFRDDELTS